MELTLERKGLFTIMTIATTLCKPRTSQIRDTDLESNFLPSEKRVPVWETTVGSDRDRGNVSTHVVHFDAVSGLRLLRAFLGGVGRFNQEL